MIQVAGTTVVMPEQRGQEIAELCRRLGVRTLSLVGSAAEGRFEPSRSDFDFVVEFGAVPRHGFRDPYFQLRAELTTLLGRQVDLIEWDAVENPLVRERLANTRRVLYAA